MFDNILIIFLNHVCRSRIIAAIMNGYVNKDIVDPHENDKAVFKTIRKNIMTSFK